MTHAADLSPTAVIRDALASRADRAVSALEARTCHSWKMALDRAGVISDLPVAAGAPGLNLFLGGGSGATVVDIDGSGYVDLCMGYGAQLLGHGHPATATAIAEQLARGWQFGLPTPAQLDLARLIQAAAPANERVTFCTSGSDAILFAMRAARAVTGKDGVAVFAGSFHGAHDYALVSAEGQAAAVGRTHKLHLGAGVPQAVDDVMTVLPYGHPAAFDLIRRRRDDLAAVVVEAVRPDDPHLDAGPWLHELGAACRAAGVMLILDEITTGFRLAYGGAQEVFGLRPDLVVYGKAVGGGLPLGVVAGRADVMRVFGPDAGAEGIFAASSFAGNPLSIAAGLATLSHLSAARTRVYPGLEAQAERLRAGFAAIAADLGVAAALRRAGSILRVGLGPDPHRGRGGAALRRAEDSFATHVLNAGVLMQAGLRGFLSTAHEAAHVERVLAAFASALAEVKADGLLGAVGRV